MAKVVFDANVIISAAFGGNPLRAVVRAMEEDEVYLSPSIAPELMEVFSKLAKKVNDYRLEGGSFISSSITNRLSS